jgi:hypothetical protein
MKTDTPETDEALSTAECEDDLVMSMRRMERQRDEAREESIRFAALANLAHIHATGGCSYIELHKVTAQRDRLAEALDKVVDAWDHAEWLDENDFESFRKALQSLTPKP